MSLRSHTSDACECALHQDSGLHQGQVRDAPQRSMPNNDIQVPDLTNALADGRRRRRRARTSSTVETHCTLPRQEEEDRAGGKTQLGVVCGNTGSSWTTTLPATRTGSHMATPTRRRRRPSTDGQCDRVAAVSVSWCCDMRGASRLFVGRCRIGVRGMCLLVSSRVTDSGPARSCPAEIVIRILWSVRSSALGASWTLRARAGDMYVVCVAVCTLRKRSPSRGLVAESGGTRPAWDLQMRSSSVKVDFRQSSGQAPLGGRCRGRPRSSRAPLAEAPLLAALQHRRGGRKDLGRHPREGRLGSAAPPGQRAGQLRPRPPRVGGGSLRRPWGVRPRQCGGGL